MGSRLVVKTLLLLTAFVLPMTAEAQTTSASASNDKSARSWTAPRTPWGDPDIQGRWPANDMQGTPYERPESFGTRATLNDKEFAEREAAQGRVPDGFHRRQRGWRGTVAAVCGLVAGRRLLAGRGLGELLESPGRRKSQLLACFSVEHSHDARVMQQIHPAAVEDGRRGVTRSLRM